jgi:hypothetical protein
VTVRALPRRPFALAMGRLVGLSGVLVMMAMVGCSSAPTPPPLAPEPEPQGPIVQTPPPEPADPLAGNEDVPRSIRRLVSEQRDEVQSIRLLAADLRDRRGRARALQEAADIADELSNIESAIVSAGTDSVRLDEVVTRLHLLETKTALMHDALRQASL